MTEAESEEEVEREKVSGPWGHRGTHLGALESRNCRPNSRPDAELRNRAGSHGALESRKSRPYRPQSSAFAEAMSAVEDRDEGSGEKRDGGSGERDEGSSSVGRVQGSVSDGRGEGSVREGRMDRDHAARAAPATAERQVLAAIARRKPFSAAPCMHVSSSSKELDQYPLVANGGGGGGAQGSGRVRCRQSQFQEEGGGGGGGDVRCRPSKQQASAHARELMEEEGRAAGGGGGTWGE